MSTKPQHNPQAVQEARAGWIASLPDPMTAKQAVELMEKVVNIGWGIFDNMCTGTCPPYEWRNPELHKAIKDAEKVRDGFEPIADRAPDAKIADKFRDLVVRTGTAVFDTGHVYWLGTAIKHKENVEKLESLASSGWTTFKILAYGTMAVVGIYAVAEVTRHVRGTTRNIREIVGT